MNKLEKELVEIRKKEDELLEKLNRKKRPDLKLKAQVRQFSFMDFSQAMVGAGVFGLPALINTSFWGYLPEITTWNMFMVHLFFIACVYITLNYDFRSVFTYDEKFLSKLTLRFFYMYLSVGIVIFILLFMLGKLHPDLNVLESLRNFLAAQSVGLVGAVTFTFIAKGFNGDR